MPARCVAAEYTPAERVLAKKYLQFVCESSIMMVDACDWRRQWGTTREHVTVKNADRLGAIFCGTQAVFLHL